MAIRDKFRRALGSHKASLPTSSASSASSSQSHHTTETPTPASSTAGSQFTTAHPHTVPVPTEERKSRSRAFTWRSVRSLGGEKSKKKRNSSLDPREKPFTATNLRYQEMLGNYEMVFGTSRTEQLWDENADISPGTSRQNSIDIRRH